MLSTDAALEEALPNLSGVNYVTDVVEWCTILKTRTLWRVLFPAPADVDDEELVSDSAVQARLQSLARSSTPYRVEHRTLYRKFHGGFDHFLSFCRNAVQLLATKIGRFLLLFPLEFWATLYCAARLTLAQWQWGMDRSDEQYLFRIAGRVR